jgi:hypothetical protein
VKSVTPTIGRASDDGNSGYGRRGGGFGGGIPGIGGIGGRRGGYGYPGGGRRRDDDTANSSQPPALKVRWQSAMPIREAELKTRDTNSPTVDENHYAIAVYGIPSRMANDDPQKLADQYKKEASLKRDGKKDIKPSEFQVLKREEGRSLYTCSHAPRRSPRRTGASNSTLSSAACNCPLRFSRKI